MENSTTRPFTLKAYDSADHLNKVAVKNEKLLFFIPPIDWGPNYFAISKARKDSKQLAAAFSAEVNQFIKSDAYRQTIENMDLTHLNRPLKPLSYTIALRCDKSSIEKRGDPKTGYHGWRQRTDFRELYRPWHMGSAVGRLGKTVPNIKQARR